jgi:RHS repeat-associated protein
MGNMLTRTMSRQVADEFGDTGTWGTSSSAFAYDGTTAKLTAVTEDGGARTVTYDAAGNELGYVAARTYSARNLMNYIAEPSEDGKPHQVTYGYDGRGVRLTRSESTYGYPAPAATRYFAYTPELQLLAVSVDDNPNVWGKRGFTTATTPAMKQEVIWFNGRPIMLRATTGDAYIFTDHLGTPILHTDYNQTITWRAEYEPYGDLYTLRTGNRTDEPLRFPGQEYAGAWEGHEERYNIFRWYRAGWGRYTHVDPLGVAGDANPYAYVYASPINWNDPLGLFTVISASPTEKKAIEAAFALIRSQLTKNNCGDCKKYFTSHPNLQDMDQWTQPGGPPYVSTIAKPDGVPPDDFAYSQSDAPFSYTWLFKQGFFPSLKRLSPCDLASLILHEAGHLARQDKTDNEPVDFFKKCKFGCIDPGKFR